MTFSATLEKSTNKRWGCHFVVPTQIAQQFGEGKSRRVVCTLKGEFEFQTALLPYGKGKVVGRVNKSIQKKLGLTIGDKVEVSLREDRNTYGLPMPDEFGEILRQDTAGNRLFQSLTAGKKRTLLYFVGSKKNPDDRAFRAVTVINHLKQNNGTINFKQLYQAVKKNR